MQCGCNDISIGRKIALPQEDCNEHGKLVECFITDKVIVVYEGGISFTDEFCLNVF